MAATEIQQSSPVMDGTLSSHVEAQVSDCGSKRGGWITFPFIAGALTGLTMAVGGWGANLVVYLIEEFNLKRIGSTQIFNVVNGSGCLLPVIGAIIADSLLGCFSVIWISYLISSLGIIILALTAMLHSLRPEPCKDGSSLCSAPSTFQLGVLYSGIALAAIGLGGTRFTIAAMGAKQFDNVQEQGKFFNWFVVVLYVTSTVGVTVPVYIEDNVSWALGFGLCVVVNIIGLASFLLGNRYYHHPKPQGSPFIGLARVLIAAIRKSKVPISCRREDYYYGHSKTEEAPTKSFRFLNHAALKTEGDTRSDNSIAKSWRLCSVQQIEDLKVLIRIFPVLLSGIFLNIPIAFMRSFTVVQALTVDRHLGPHFKVPAGSMIVFTLTSTAISLSFIDWFLYPMWQKMTHRSYTPFQRIGLGHLFNVASIAVAALVESKRLKIARTHQSLNQPSSTIPMSILWLVPQMAVSGFGEALHYPRQVTLYYQEFPKSLGNTATAMISMIMGIAFYLSTSLINLVQRNTQWLPNNINHGRLNNVYWMLVVLGLLNFGYFLICAWFYKYQNVERRNDNHNSDG